MHKIKNILTRIRYIRNWWTVIPPLNRFRSKDVILTLRHGERIMVHDLFGRQFSSLMQVCEDFDAYLPYYRELKNVKSIVDAGAFMGVVSIQLARLFPNATVYAIEPNPENLELVRENIQLNSLTNVVIVHAALSAQEGVVNLNIDSDSASHSIAVKLQTNTGTIEVPAVTLKSYSPIDILKMDIEGAEYDVLKDTPDVKLMLLEVHDRDGYERKELRAALAKHFEIVEKNEGGFVQSADMLICRAKA